MPARAPKNMENLVKIVVSETKTTGVEGLLERERAVADTITHELLLLASDAVCARQLTSQAFPQSGRGNYKLLAHVVARAVGGWINYDFHGEQAVALKVGKRLDAQVQAVRAALARIADEARVARSREMHRAHAASDACEVLALPAALAAAEAATANKHHRQQTEIYIAYHELMRTKDTCVVAVPAATPNADRRTEQAVQERQSAQRMKEDVWKVDFNEVYEMGHKDGRSAGRMDAGIDYLLGCKRCTAYREANDRLHEEIKTVDRLRTRNESLEEQFAELQESEREGRAIEEDLRARVAQLEKELYWSKGREDALRDLLRANFVLKPAPPQQGEALAAAYESLPKYGSSVK